MRRPSSVRIGMFCRFGSDEESRPVVVAARANEVCQIELRLLAHIADIPQLREAFEQGIDIHAATASAMFGVALDQMTGDLRRRAKTINFGIR
jgi:DNA polymerase I-like protein with 3'-5' exonuclease and polymerase domains